MSTDETKQKRDLMGLGYSEEHMEALFKVAGNTQQDFSGSVGSFRVTTDLNETTNLASAEDQAAFDDGLTTKKPTGYVVIAGVAGSGMKSSLKDFLLTQTK